MVCQKKFTLSFVVFSGLSPLWLREEEVYFFISGQGEMQLDDDKFSVEPGDTVLIKDGVFHKVYNPSDEEELYFICVLHGARQNKPPETSGKKWIQGYNKWKKQNGI